ncbi:MAG TPA: hypothetical protein VLG12_02040 [Candidatus Saccharimonadales bacterium]|nr:hypothetical protein [Candidatus Saccharimonadales bacterium]
MRQKVEKQFRETFLHFGSVLIKSGIVMLSEDEINLLQTAIKEKKIAEDSRGNEILWLEFLNRGFYAETYEEPEQENVVNFEKRRRTAKDEPEEIIPKLVRLKAKPSSQQPTPSSDKKMKFCRNCRTQYVVAEQSYCIQCGQQLPPQPNVLYCPRCRNPHQGNHAFCGTCGFRFNIPTTIPQCKNCGNPIIQGQQFCGCCGVKNF